MRRKGRNGGNKGKGSDPIDLGGDDHVLEYTPDTGFNIRQAAREFSLWMEETGLSLLLHLPHVSVEVEAGCTPREIIDGYFYAMKQRGGGALPSNCNSPVGELLV